MNIKDIVKNNTVTFVKLRHQVAYYRVVELGLVFPVPLEDIGDATLWDTEKAITYMRYIRKAIADNTLQKDSN